MSTNMSGIDAKKVREAAKLSQAAVAAAVGLNRTYYSLYESGRLALTDSQYSALDKFLCAHDTSPPPATNLLGAHDESARKTDCINSVLHTAGKPPQRSKKIQANPPHSNVSRVQIAFAKLNGLERAVAIEQITGHRIPFLIERTFRSLQKLEYPDLLKLCVQLGISLPTLDFAAEPETHDANKQKTMELQIEQVIVCHAIYGKAFLECGRSDLYKITCELRKVFSCTDRLVPFPSLFEQAFESDAQAKKTTWRLRLEVIPYLLRCANAGIAIYFP